MGMFDDLIPAQPGPPGAPPAAPPAKGMFDDLIPQKPPPGPPTGTNGTAFAGLGPDDIYAVGLSGGAPKFTPGDVANTAAGLAKAAGSGFNAGIAGLVASPAAIPLAVQGGVNKMRAWLTGRPEAEIQAETDARAIIPRQPLENWVNRAEEVRRESPLNYEPQNLAERYAHAAGEFIPASVTGPGGVARKLIGGGVIPGLTSEAAKQGAEALGAGQTGQTIAGIAGAMAGGIPAMRTLGPNVVERTIGDQMARIPVADRQGVLTTAQGLMRDAQAQGIPLSWANAIDQASGRVSNLSNTQRIVEGSGRMQDFYATAPAATEAAGRQAFEQITPASQAPSGLGRQVGRAAEQEIAATQAEINRQTRPLYQQAEQVQVGPQIHAGITSDPIYAQALKEVRADPQLNATIANLPDDSVGVMDLVQRHLEEQARNARVPGQASTSNLRAGNLEGARAPAIAAAETATGSRPAAQIPQSHAIINGVPHYLNPNGTLGGPIPGAVAGTYEQARAAQQTLRERFLQPLMDGPLGRIAGQPETRQAIEALFPANPLPNSAQEIVTAVGALNARNPVATRQLVRAHAESVFNELTQNLTSGPNQWGGAGFAAALRGNPQQAANLAAALHAIGGPQLVNGFDRFLNVLEATGARQRTGSQTAFNAVDLERLRSAGIAEGAIKIAAGGGVKLPSKMMQTIEEWRLGRNLDQLASLFTDPNAITTFKRLADMPPTGARMTGLMGRLVSLGMRGSGSGPLVIDVAPRGSGQQ